MTMLRRWLLVLLMIPVAAWLIASAALALCLPTGWRVRDWPVSVPGLAVATSEGALLRWSPMDWRGMRLTGQNFTPRGSRLGPVTALDAELALRGPVFLNRRLEGTHIEVTGLSVVWGPLRFSGSGQLFAMDDGSLSGPLRGRMEGFQGAMAMLSQTGILSGGARAGGEVELPLALHRDGRVMLGPLLIANWR